MAELTTFEKIMFQKNMVALNQARQEGDLVEVEQLVKKIAPIVDKMNEQVRVEFQTQLNDFNMVADKFDEGANIVNDGLANFSAVDQDEFNQLMQQEMQNAADKLFSSKPNTPTRRVTQRKNLSEEDKLVAEALDAAALELVNTFPEAPKHEAPNPPKKTAQQPAKQTQHQQQQKKRQAQRDNLRKAHENKMQKLQQAKQRFEKIAQQAKEQTNPQVQTQAETKPSSSPNKDNPLHQYIDRRQKDLTKRRKASMIDAKNDVKNAYKAIRKLLSIIVDAITKAPEQEKKLSEQDQQIIEQSAEQLTKPGVTPEQAIAHTGTILNQVDNPSENQDQVNQETVAPVADKGWLTRALNKVSAALTTASNTLGFKSKKEDLLQTLEGLDANDTHKATHEQDKPEISQDNEQEQEPPSSGFQ
ncbi:MAG: hypothetical protein P1U36_02170 [Legionellaceae bacterium]|nr:hypothetical protein [Legionellaceae bacterium]